MTFFPNLLYNQQLNLPINATSINFEYYHYYLTLFKVDERNEIYNNLFMSRMIFATIYYQNIFKY